MSAAYMRFTEDEIAKRNRCAECGMRLTGPAEFHPHLFCVMFKAGYPNPAEYLRANGWTRRAES